MRFPANSFLSSLFFTGLLVALSSLPASAQTNQATSAARDTTPAGLSEQPPLLDTQGAYVAPGMTGAPKQDVLTDYRNRPIKKRIRALKKERAMHQKENSTLSSPTTPAAGAPPQE